MDLILAIMCTKCQSTLPVSSFHKNRRTRTGYQSWCKQCMDIKRGTKKKLAAHRPGLQFCYSCNRYKQDIEFYEFRRSRCKACVAAALRSYRARNPDKAREWDRLRRERTTPEKQKDWSLRKAYNLSLNEFKELCEKQNYACAICGDKTDALKVDHCHTTGVFRGLLCSFCNSGLGYFKDRGDILLSAAAYLKRFR